MRSRSLVLIALAVGWGVVARPATGQVPDARRLKAEAYASIDEKADRLGRLSDAIFSYAEIGFQEVNTIRLVTGELEKAGFRVERGVARMPTAYRATYGSGHPVIGLMSDFDCVPGASQWPATLTHSQIVEGAPGHGEGHNTHQPTIIGAALAIKELLDRYDLPGTIVVYGGPAEELVASRGYMVNAGLFDGVDVAMDVHIGSQFGTGYGLNNLANVSVEWTFKGVQGHGARPWTAKSALDAVELMNVGMNYLREHLPLEMRFHYVITDGGKQPNVVPGEASVWYYFRQRDYEGVVALWERARLVAEGAALMTGTTASERVLSGSWPINNNKALAQLIQSNVQAVGMPKWSADDIAFAEAFQRAMGMEEITGLPEEVRPLERATQGSSTSDVGDITWNIPYARMYFPARVDGALGGHHWSAAIVPGSPLAHKGIVVGAKAVAGTLVDLLTDPTHLERIKADFASDMEGVTWKSLIPPGAEPPTHLNVAQMQRYRPLLEPFYYDPDSPQTLFEFWGIEYPPQWSGATSRNR